jgi:hypothetical protein
MPDRENDRQQFPPWLGRLLCRLGFHDYRVIDVIFEFGSDPVEKDQCRRCGAIRTRIAK